MALNITELLESSGPIALNELNMRSSEDATELMKKLYALKKSGEVVVRGPKADKLLELTPEDVSRSSDTLVELSRSRLKRSFAS